MVACFNSHFPTHSQGKDFVSNLSEFVQVDIYGKCGKMECLPGNCPHCNSLLKQYKFCLFMENIFLCSDKYVTEEFYRALSLDIIPIVYGGADYYQYAPAHSYINIADFKSPKELADYLQLLDQNNAFYLEYFEWKKFYQVVGPVEGWRALYYKLNE